VITRVDDRAITDADSLVATIRSYRPGDEVEVTWQRDGEEQSATLELDSDATEG
jgi:putative serine protease PepD